MKNEVDDFLKGLNNEPKDDPFKPDVSDPFGGTEKVKEEPKEAYDKEDEKPLPFNKDPKVQRFIEKEISKRLSGIKPTETESFKKDVSPESDEVTEVLTRIIGNDTPERQSAIRDFKKVLSGLEEKGAQKALQQIQEQADEDTRKEAEAAEELREGFENLEEEFEVDLSSNTASAKKLRSDFVDYITRIAPKDREGQVVAFPDLKASFEEFQEKAKRPNESTSRAKELSSRSMARSADASNAPKVTDNSWKAIDKLFSKNT